MFNNLFCMATLIVGIPLTVWSQESLWKKIVPVESTITDVERMFGRPIDRDHSLRYETNDGIYYFSFSDGVCKTKWKEEWNSKIPELPPLREGEPLTDWNLPEWTIERVLYSPNEWISVRSLGIDLSRLEKIKESPDTPDIFSYRDGKNGISYTVQYEFDQNHKVAYVTSITLFPKARYKNLLCK